MINFIVCDDDEKYRVMVENIILKYMMNNKLDYKIHSFNDYGKEFINFVNKKMSHKIYILDIEAPSRSGIDVARIIRNKDVNSIIIFLTGHQELGSKVIENVFLFLSFINKFDNCEKKLVKTLNEAFKIIDTRKTLRFKDNGILYTINFNDILYIMRDTVSRKSVIKTDYSEFKVGTSLLELTKKLDSNFIKCHRACIVNKKRVLSFKKSERVITLDSGEELNLVSSRFKGDEL